MTLLAPAFLAGLLAIGLPLWLHRLSSDNPNKQRFSSLMFLEPGEPRRVLAKKLQYLLLLALRIALLVLLALAFAQPAFWRSPSAAAADGGARLHLIVLDRSGSMGYGDRWERALDEAREIIAEIGTDDRGLVLAAGRSIEVLPGGEATSDQVALRQVLAAIEPSAFRVEYGTLMRSVEGVLRGADLPAVVHVITDLQQTAIPTPFAELAPRRTAEIVVHDIGAGATQNFAIESFSGSAVTGELEASVKSFAAEPAQRTVELVLNGETVERKMLDIPAGGRANARFAAVADRLMSGGNRLVVRLVPGDELTLDDERYLAMRRAEPRSVLIVAADPTGTDGLFVDAALAPLTKLALTPERAKPEQLAARDLRAYSFIVVTDAGVLDSGVETQLREYVERGGAVLLAMREQTARRPTLPITGQALTRASPSEDLDIGDIDSNHPALRGVDDLRGAKYRRYVGLTPAPEDRVLIALEDGAPLLVERMVGDAGGRVLIYTSTLNRDWNDLPTRPVFVTFMAGVANHLLGGEGLTTEAELGSTLAVSALNLRGGQIFDPRGERAFGLQSTSADVLLDQVGFYVVEGGGTTHLVAVSFDARESDLTPDPGLVERWQALGAAGAAAQQGVTVAQDEEKILRPVGLWLLLLLIAAGLMESVVGNWHLKVRRGIAA